MTPHSRPSPERRERRPVRWPAVALGVLLLVAACGGSSSSGHASTSTSPSPTPSSASAPTGSAAQQIRTAWAMFFKGSTPAAAKIALLQHGSSVAAVIRAQAGSPLSQGTAATVSAVKVTSPQQATVHYTITINGKPALAHQSGLAVKAGGHWLVSLASFCGLLSLEGTHPSACASAG